MMRKRIQLLASLTLGVVALAALLAWLSADPTAPKFRPVAQPLPIPPYHNLSYEFLSPCPFEGGKLWISIWSGTNAHHCYLYDLDRKMVLGELFNAGPVFMNSDQSRLLCAHGTLAKRSSRGSFKRQLGVLFRNLLRGKLSPVENDTETFWTLDLRDGSATRLGLLQSSGTTSFMPSPSFRYGYNKPSASFGTPELFICDLERRLLLKHAVDGLPLGWWSDSEIVFKDPSNNFTLYDVATSHQRPLLSAAAVAGAFAAAGLSNSLTQANLFFMWNGRQNEFYLADAQQRWRATNSYLFKMERPGGALKLLAGDFKFEWSDHFSPGATSYLYSGRQVGDRSSGVFLRDLATGTNRTLVAPDGSRSFSLPHFYHDTVIYTRSNQLWQVGLDGTKPARLFPPPNEPASAR